MYMPGRLRTASRPSRTVIALASYATPFGPSAGSCALGWISVTGTLRGTRHRSPAGLGRPLFERSPRRLEHVRAERSQSTRRQPLQWSVQPPSEPSRARTGGRTVPPTGLRRPPCLVAGQGPFGWATARGSAVGVARAAAAYRQGAAPPG